MLTFLKHLISTKLHESDLSPRKVLLRQFVGHWVLLHLERLLDIKAGIRANYIIRFYSRAWAECGLP